jgi:hypothetical protein
VRSSSDIAHHAAARLQQLQSRIDRVNGAVDGLADVRDHKSPRRPRHRQSHPALEKALRLLSSVPGSSK